MFCNNHMGKKNEDMYVYNGFIFLKPESSIVSQLYPNRIKNLKKIIRGKVILVSTIWNFTNNFGKKN